MDSENVLISVQTINLSKSECEEIIRKQSSEVANKFFLGGLINILQFSYVVDHTTKSLIKHYNIDRREIRKSTVNNIRRVLKKHSERM